MLKLLRYSVDLIARPHVALRALLDDPRRVLFGVLGPLALAIVYFIGITVALALNVAPRPQFLVLDIPPEQYYAYERFFILPVALAGIILASGVIRLVARWWDGRGRFEDLFALLGFSMIIIAVVMGLPDLVIVILTGRGVLAPAGWSAIGLHVWVGTLWYAMLMVLAVRHVERLPWTHTVVLALLGFVANAGVQAIFIR